MQNNKYVLGLDLGVGSVGWSCVLFDNDNQPYRILDLNSYIFDPSGSSVEDRRLARGARRMSRRKKSRIKRIRNLFVKYGYLSNEEIISFINVKNKEKIDIYKTRLKGKKEELTMEELCSILIHYSKGRGFKSNRKFLEENIEETKSGNEERKLLAAKQQTEKKIAEKRNYDDEYTITNLLLEIRGDKNRIRNTSGVYQVGITRAMIQDEVSMILDFQISKKVITESFKSECMEIIFAQRLFSEGPEEPSPYNNPLQKMIGVCRFTKEPRVAKSTLSYELFVLVQKLHDIRYYEENSRSIKSLEVSELTDLTKLALGGKDVTFALVEKVIGRKVNFKGLYLTKSKYFEVANSMKDKTVDEKKTLFDKEKKKKSISKLVHYKRLKNELKKILGKGYVVTTEQYDLIGDCLTQCKSDTEIENYLNGNRAAMRDVVLQQELIEAVKNIDDKHFTGYGKVSLKFLHEVLPLMMNEGFDYSRACIELGYNHTTYCDKDNDFDKMPIINEVLEDLDKTITNKSVSKTLVMARKIVNAVINKYGKPMAIHVEMARELTKSDAEKKEIENEQYENQTKNIAQKHQIYSKHSDKFRSVNSISRNDIIQHRLFIEQDGICPYTLLRTGSEQKSKIHESELFTGALEVDHIIPYSLCFDDRFVNKVLVKKQENQEKGNQTPLQCFKGEGGESKYRAWINNNHHIGLDKQSRLLADKVDVQLLNDYRARTINDTRYAAKAFKEILSYSFSSVKIRSFTGQITANLRNVYRLNSKTHSIESQEYKKIKSAGEELEKLYNELSKLIEIGVERQSKEYYQLLQKIRKTEKEDNKKNRDNHLHHALDATIIAIATDSLRRRVETHEMALRQRKFNELKIMVRVFDNETGEVSELIEKIYSKEEYKSLIFGEASLEKAIFPEPYKDFCKELLLRTYEQDKNRLRNSLSALPQYKGVDLNTIQPLFISHHYSSRISGRLHKATYYGLKEKDNQKKLTSRIPINSEKFDEKKLEKMYDKEETQKYIYEATKEWLKGCKNGSIAFKEHGGQFPKNRNGNNIKKIKLDVGVVKEEFSLKDNMNQYVEKENVVQVWVYSRKDDDKLYFVGMDRFRIMNIKKRKDLHLLLWYGQGKKHLEISVSELSKSGFCEKPTVLHKGQVLFIEKDDGSCGLAKLVGCASGMLEVNSILGDGLDLVASGLFEKKRTQYQLTVSTISSIKPISVSVLGKIESNYGI